MAVNEGNYMGQLYAALGEAAFLMGIEKNQDIVTLASYAPLFENVNYRAWYPNLIRFNNHQSLGIPTYYVWKMFGQNRGEYVVRSEDEGGRVYRPRTGMASLKSNKELRFRNPIWNGEEAKITHELMGHVQDTEDGCLLQLPDEEQKRNFTVFWNGLMRPRALWYLEKKTRLMEDLRPIFLLRKMLTSSWVYSVPGWFVPIMRSSS